MEQNKHSFLIRKANPDEATAIHALCKAHHANSFAGKYFPHNPSSAQSNFEIAVTHPEIDTFVADSEGLLLGVAIITYNPSFIGGVDANLDFFYIDPDFRATGVSRELAARCKDAMYERDANFLITECQAEIADDGGVNARLYNNLFLKLGFKELPAPATYLVNEKKVDHGNF